jgi:hypothetical protein
VLDDAREAVADAPGGAAVEAEHELVEIGRQVLVADSAVVGTEQPPLGEAEHQGGSPADAAPRRPSRR